MLSSLRIPGALATLALAPLTLAAADAVPSSDISVPSSQAPAFNYAAAFDKLFSFGLPDTRGAKFVKADNLHDRFGNQESFVPELTGFAWRTSDTDKTKVIVNGVAVFEGFAQPDDNNPFVAFAVFSNPAQFPPGSTFPASIPLRPADLKKEVVAAHARLLAWKDKRAKKGAKDSSSRDGMDDWARREAPARLAAYLILAAHAHRAGLSDDANRLAGLALSCADKPDAVAKAAISPLADIRWGAALHAWSGKPDATAADLATELEAVYKRFAGGWKSAPAARHLLKQLRRAQAPQAPSLEGYTFSAEQLKLAADLLSLREMPAESDWLSAAKPGDNSNPLIASLRKMGVEALPVLGVLADDSAPGVCLPKPNPHGGMNDLGEDTDESQREWRDRNAYEQWSLRPMTRGEIASALLRMPKGYCFDLNEERSFSDGVLVDYHTLKREGKVGLLLEKAAVANNWQRQQVWSALVASVDSDADAAKLEAAIVDLPDKADLLATHLRPYLRKRGPKAADFLQKFSSTARAELDELDDEAFVTKAKDHNYQMSFRMRGAQPPSTKAAALADFDKQLEKLRALVLVTPAKASSGDPLGDILDEVENSDGPVHFAFGGDDESSPLARLKGLVRENGDAWDKVLPAILERAAKTKDSKKQSLLLSLSQGLVFQSGQSASPTPGQIAKVLPHCRALLASAGDSLQRKMGLFQFMEMLFEGKKAFGMNSGMQSLQHLDIEEINLLLQSRFDARAEGKPVPDWPSAAKVSAEQLTSVVSRLASAATPEDFRARHAGLSPDEKVAWGAEFARNPEACSPAIAKARSRISRLIAEEPESKAFVKAHGLDAFIGRDLDAKVARELFARVIAKAPKKAMVIGFGQVATQTVAHVNVNEHGQFLGGAGGDTPKAQAYFLRQSVGVNGSPMHDNGNANFAIGAPSLDTPDAEKFWKLLETPPADGARIITLHLGIVLPAAPEADKDTKK